MAVVNVLRLRRVPILQQLRVEEALLRADGGNWCLLNDGCPRPAIVMGISGKLEDLVDVAAAKREGTQIIKRFSGGGTVIVDEDTVFATLIIADGAVPKLECYPRPIMSWTEKLYGQVFNPYGSFSLAEHDYVFGQHKFGGNAQAITKQRWLHHTSLLWDFKPVNMALLKHPRKVPDYREGRDHDAFLCRLKDFMPSRMGLLDSIEAALQAQGFALRHTPLSQAEAFLEQDYFRNIKEIAL